jgi:hypothetical protein
VPTKKKRIGYVYIQKYFVRSSVADPGIRDRCLFDPLDPGSGMGKKSRSGMNIPDHISESLETIF